MYNIKKPLIDQLSFIHLQKSVEISKVLFNENNLIKLNEKSLKMRGKK